MAKGFLNKIDNYGYLRPMVYFLKSLFRNPFQLIREILIDLKKDIKTDSKIKKPIICFGLPKSGTTMIEEILSLNGCVDATRSILRRISYLPKNENPHGISENFLKFLPKTKWSFIKTHTHFDPKYIKILNDYGVDYFISIRDPRQMMLSRYYHVLNDKNHWQHKSIIKLKLKEGFKKSLFANSIAEIDPIQEYSNWIKNHIKNTNKILKYEDYINNPNEYLNELSNYSEIRIDIKKTLKIIRDKKSDLSRNFKKSGRNKSTFRKGMLDEWKMVFDKEIKDIFKLKFGDLLIRLDYEKNYDW